MCEIFGVLHKVKSFILCLSFFSDNGTVCTSTYPIFGQVGHGPLFFTRSVCSSKDSKEIFNNWIGEFFQLTALYSLATMPLCVKFYNSFTLSWSTLSR